MLLLLLGALTGVLLGASGAGGAVLAVPLLIGAGGLAMDQAAPVALLGVAAAATLGTALAWNVAHVRYRAAALMGLGSIVAAPAALWLGGWLSRSALEALFALVLALVAVRLLTPSPGAKAGPTLCRLDPDSGRIAWDGGTVAYVTGTGAIAGTLATLLGVGGGFVIVPSLRTFSELPAHSVVATSLMAVAIISTVGFTTGLVGGAVPDWTAAVPFTAGALAGMAVSRRWVSQAPGSALQAGLAVAMLLLSAVMAARALGLA